MTFNFQPRMEGEEILLRPLEACDWEQLFAVASDPQIWAQHPFHERWEERVFRPYFDGHLMAGGTLAVVNRADGLICGSSTYSNYRSEGGGAIEIGSTFLGRSHWGTGANAEMKRLMLGHALAEVETVEFLIGDTNLRSRRAIEKIGGVLTDRTLTAELPGRTALHLIYEIDRANFANGPLSA